MQDPTQNVDNKLYDKHFEGKILAWRKNEIKDIDYEWQKKHYAAIKDHNRKLNKKLYVKITKPGEKV